MYRAIVVYSNKPQKQTNDTKLAIKYGHQHETDQFTRNEFDIVFND